MTIKLVDIENDKVIESVYCSGKTTYEFALQNFYPRIHEFHAQRKIQDQKFYKRLRQDLINGCLMPPITLAFVDSNPPSKPSDLEKFVNQNLGRVVVLDGIQRLVTLKSASEDKELNHQQTLYVNIIISPSEDQLVYRMITLNNGQKPMTPIHQIEILTSSTFDFGSLGLPVQTEKERGENPMKGTFKLGDISRGCSDFSFRRNMIWSIEAEILRKVRHFNLGKNENGLFSDGNF